MLSTKDKNKLKKMWDGNKKFVHRSVKDYSPYGDFHDLNGVETQVTNGVRAGFETFSVKVLTHSDEGGVTLQELTYDSVKKAFV